MQPKFPELCTQSVCRELGVLTEWWTTRERPRPLAVGQLVWAYIPTVHPVPNALEVERSDLKSHTSLRAKLRPLTRGVPPRPDPPILALPRDEATFHLVSECKRRPAIVVALPTKSAPTGTSSKQRFTALIAPYYSADRTETRAGLPAEFVALVQRGKVPNMFWDYLPLKSTKGPSIVRWDRIQPVHVDDPTLDPQGYALHSDAVPIIQQWLQWHLTGRVETDSTLEYVLGFLNA